MIAIKAAAAVARKAALWRAKEGCAHSKTLARLISANNAFYAFNEINEINALQARGVVVVVGREKRDEGRPAVAEAMARQGGNVL